MLFILAPLVSVSLSFTFWGEDNGDVIDVFAACFTVVFFFVPNLWIALTFDMLHVWFAAMAIPAFAVLILEQLPKYRATLFSLNSFFNNIGKGYGTTNWRGIACFLFWSLRVSWTCPWRHNVIGCLVLFFAVKDLVVIWRKIRLKKTGILKCKYIENSTIPCLYLNLKYKRQLYHVNNLGL